MRFENQGLSLWLHTPDAPAPSDVLPPGVEASVTVGMSPPDASNQVMVQYRIDRGSVMSVDARWFRNTSDAQYFTARLPAFPQGARVEYWVAASCAGTYVPSLPEVGIEVLSFFVMEGEGHMQEMEAPARRGVETPSSAWPTPRAADGTLPATALLAARSGSTPPPRLHVFVDAGVQTGRLVMTGLSVLKDQPPHDLQPTPLRRGIHLRWSFTREAGFPWGGYYLFRRPHQT